MDSVTLLQRPSRRGAAEIRPVSLERGVAK
jgi:hypothetical protein